MFSFLFVKFSFLFFSKFFLWHLPSFLFLLKLVGGEEVPLETSLIHGSPGTWEQECQRPFLLSRTEGPGEDLGKEQGPQGPPKAPRGWGNPGRRSLHPPGSCPPSLPRQAAPLGP